jgi:hypothetical protein
VATIKGRRKSRVVMLSGATQTIPNATNASVVYTSKNVDTNGEGTLATGQIVPKRAGRWAFTFGLHVYPTVATRIITMLWAGNGELYRFADDVPPINQNYEGGGTVVTEVAAGVPFYVVCYASPGVSLVGAGNLTYLEGVEL